MALSEAEAVMSTPEPKFTSSFREQRDMSVPLRSFSVSVLYEEYMKSEY
jgi:hypothetical protein